MEAATQIEAIVEVANRLGIEVRRERLGGNGGGFCKIRGKIVLFLDEDADLATRLDRCLAGLSSLPDITRVYLPPEIREKMGS